MLSADARSRLMVVLVGARNPANIGAAARAMRDFGFSDLRFVNAYTAPFEAAQLEAVSSAVAAGEVMRAARAFSTLADAIADATEVVGTTAVGERALPRPLETLAAATPQLCAALAHPHGRVALLFGSEKTGLTNEQLSLCTRLITIPLVDPALVDAAPADADAAGDAANAPGRAAPTLASNTTHTPRHLSMNLGQAVAVCLYELVRDGLADAKALPAAAGLPISADDRARLTAALAEAMQHTGYARRFPANARDTVVRRFAAQLGTTRDEATAWLGLLKLIVRASESPAEAGLNLDPQDDD